MNRMKRMFNRFGQTRDDPEEVRRMREEILRKHQVKHVIVKGGYKVPPRSETSRGDRSHHKSVQDRSQRKDSDPQKASKSSATSRDNSRKRGESAKQIQVRRRSPSTVRKNEKTDVRSKMEKSAPRRRRSAESLPETQTFTETEESYSSYDDEDSGDEYYFDEETCANTLKNIEITAPRRDDLTPRQMRQTGRSPTGAYGRRKLKYASKNPVGFNPDVGTTPYSYKTADTSAKPTIAKLKPSK